MTEYDDEARSVFGDPELDPDLVATFLAEREAELVRDRELEAPRSRRDRHEAALTLLAGAVASLGRAVENVDDRLDELDRRIAELEARA